MKSVREREKHAARRRDRRSERRRFAAGERYQPIVTWDEDALAWRYNPEPVRALIDLTIRAVGRLGAMGMPSRDVVVLPVPGVSLDLQLGDDTVKLQLVDHAAAEASMDGDMPDPFTAPPDPAPHAWRTVVADPFDPDAEDAVRAADLARTHEIPHTMTRRECALEELRWLFDKFELLSLPELWRYTSLEKWEIPYFMSELEREGFALMLRHTDDPTWLRVRSALSA